MLINGEKKKKERILRLLMKDKKITIKLDKKDVKEIYETDDYLRTVKSDLLENVLGKIMFQLDKRPDER